MNSEIYIFELANGQHYIGSTSDFDRRLLDHQSGRAISTKGKLSIRVVFRKECNSLKQARQIGLK